MGANVAFLVGLFAAYYAGVALETLGSWVAGTPLLEYRFPFGVFVMTCILWLSYLIVQARGFGLLARRHGREPAVKGGCTTVETESTLTRS